jgi:hypothetical protein
MTGMWYAFKWGAIYRVTRTGDVGHAYDPICVTKARGAMPGSIVNAVDEAGRPATYFLDPAVGPCSVGAAGLRDLVGLQATWRRVTVASDSVVVCRGLYYPDKRQIHWWVAVDGSTTPNLKIIVQVDAIRPTQEGKARGAFLLADGLIATARSAGIWHEITTEDGEERLRARPFIGLATGDDVTAAQMLQRCDIGDDDNGVAFEATLTTRPLMLAGLMDTWGITNASVLVTPSATARLKFTTVRDFGVETRSRSAVLAAHYGEDYLTMDLDDLAIAELRTLQFTFADAPVTTQWQLHRLEAKVRGEQTS